MQKTMLQNQQSTNRLKPYFLHLLIIFIFTIIIQLCFQDFFLEDAYIHVRYVENTVSSGAWSSWNIGEKPVSGDSSPLWLAILVVLKFIGISPYLGSKIIASMAFIACLTDLVTFYNAKRKSKGLLMEIVFTISLFTLIPMLFYSVSGIETILFVFLISRLVLSGSRFGHALAAIGLSMVRPEGVLFVLGITATKYWKDWITIIKTILPAFFLYIAYLLFHKSYFGYMLPNTYYAKADLPMLHAIIYGCRTLALFLKDYYLVMGFAGLYFLSGQLKKSDKIILALAVIILFFIFKVGGDNAAAFPHHRHILPLILFAWIYAFLTAEDIASKYKHGNIVMFFILCVLFWSHFSSEMHTEHSPFRNTKQIVKKLLRLPLVGKSAPETSLPSTHKILSYFPDGESFASCSAGETPSIFLKLNFIDMLGLNDEYIARNGTRQYGQTDTKTEYSYVLSRSPGLIEQPIASSHIQTNRVQIGSSHWREVVDQFLSDDRLYQNYWFLPSSGSSIFIHNRIVPLLPKETRDSLSRYRKEKSFQ